METAREEREREREIVSNVDLKASSPSSDASKAIPTE
jgi:hypothetical protein